MVTRYLVAAILVMALAATILYYRGQYINARAEAARLTATISDLQATNAQQQETINNLARMRETIDRINSNLSKELDAINNAITSQTDDLRQIKESNASVKDFLSLPVPDELKRLRK